MPFKDGVPWLDGDDNGFVEVVGAKHYQSTLGRLARDYKLDRTKDSEVEVVATLVLEDDNDFDANAVRVDIDGHKVGYLSRVNAKAFRAGLDDLFPGKFADRVQCGALIEAPRVSKFLQRTITVSLDLPSGKLGLE
jgi:hypothetical protein